MFEPYAAYSLAVRAAKLTVYCRTNDYISLMYSFNFDDDDMLKMGYMRFGITIDMRTGKRVFINDIVSDKSTLSELITEFEYNNPDSPIHPPMTREDADNMIRWSAESEADYVNWWIDNSDDKNLSQGIVLDLLRSKPTFVITSDTLIMTRSPFPDHDVVLQMSVLNPLMRKIF